MSDDEISISPKKNLYRSLDNKRIIIDQPRRENVAPSTTNTLSSSSYKLLEQSPCKDYFFHIDTCKTCQRRLERRIKNYIEKRKINVRPGSSGVDIDVESLLFSDHVEDNIDNIDNIERKNKGKPKRRLSYAINDNTNDNIEGFQNLLPSCIQSRPMYILLFGIFVIFVLDKISSK